MKHRLTPQAAPRLRIARFRAEIDAAVSDVLAGPSYILGESVERFEQEFAAFAQVSHCVGVASGTDALTLALRGLGIGPGQEVIVPALTFAGTAQAVLQCGAIPRFVDVDATTRCIDPGLAEAAVNSRTSAIIPVHLFGAPCAMPRLLAIADRHGLVAVEDCAQSHGATLDGVALGSFGHAAAYSFYPTKNLGCVGDGGAVVTRDAQLARRIRSLRNYGFQGSERVSKVLGFNSRLDEIQAAILRVLLPHLEESNRERRAIAAAYRRCLPNSEELGQPVDSVGCVYHQFAITHPRRDGLAARLDEAGIGTAVHYSPGLHRHPAFVSASVPHLPVADRLADTLLSLPIQPEVAAHAVEHIAGTIASWPIAA